MTTTIQVSDETKQLLQMIREREDAKSYDEVIQHVLKTHAQVPKSMFGALKGFKWKKKDRI